MTDSVPSPSAPPTPQPTTAQPTTLTREGARSMVFTRRFAHPPDRLMRAHLTAEAVRRWVSSDAHAMAECRVDGVPGGEFHYVWDGPNGFAVSGRFEEITARRIVHVERFEPDLLAGEARVITDFDPIEGGGTLLRMQVIYASAAARDGAGAEGMAEGMPAAFDRLDALPQPG